MPQQPDGCVSLQSKTHRHYACPTAQPRRLLMPLDPILVLAPPPFEDRCKVMSGASAVVQGGDTFKPMESTEASRLVRSDFYVPPVRKLTTLELAELTA